MGNKAGKIAESFFSSVLYKNGLDYKFLDSWYDYLVEGVKVELKSCRLTITGRYMKGSKQYDGNRIGRFDFTNEENREKIKKENIWIALVVRHYNSCILLGFIEGSKIDSRYLSLHKARKLGLIQFNEWTRINKFKTEVRSCPYCGRELIL